MRPILYIRLFFALFASIAWSNPTYAVKLTNDSVASLISKSSSAQVRVMVEFKQAPRTTNSSLFNVLSQTDREIYLSSILKRKSNQRAAQSNLGGRYIRPNLRTISVTKPELQNLVADDALNVYEDKFHRPSLGSSVSVIFPNQTTSAYSGSGQVVAVLDTGVAKDHSFLSSKVIEAAEACFSTNESGQFLESLCPNNQEIMVGSGAAAPCAAAISDCAHGTQMAGAIAGQGANFNGVATSADIIAVQVFSKGTDEVVCGNAANTPCIGALTSDIISGLDYIDSIKGSYSIAAVNLSFETTGTYQGVCDTQNEPAGYLNVISNLTSSGIAVIASSGNGAKENEMASPACISEVIAVAATNDNDTPWTLNNRNSELDFFAPGVAVSTSTLPTSTFVTGSGTSIAAAHVSGAWAVMKSMNPTANVTTIKNAFINTGRSVTQGLFTKPRINLTLALGETPPMTEIDSSFLPSIYLLLFEE